MHDTPEIDGAADEHADHCGHQGKDDGDGALLGANERRGVTLNS
jgi:hypothetical protein